METRSSYPARMRKGKVIGLPVCLSFIAVAKSRVLGICACCNYNESVDIGEKVVSVRFELLNTAHWRYKSCISVQHACGLLTAPTPCVM